MLRLVGYGFACRSAQRAAHLQHKERNEVLLLPLLVLLKEELLLRRPLSLDAEIDVHGVGKEESRNAPIEPLAYLIVPPPVIITAPL